MDSKTKYAIIALTAGLIGGFALYFFAKKMGWLPWEPGCQGTAQTQALQPQAAALPPGTYMDRSNLGPMLIRPVEVPKPQQTPLLPKMIIDPNVSAF